MNYLSYFFSDVYYLGIFALIISFILALKMFPAIICLANEKDLMAVPETRSMHTKKTPNLGGVGIFIAFSLSIMILGGLKSFEHFQIGQLLLLLAAITIMFFLGVKDDLIGISPKKKFLGQAMAAALVILVTDVRINNLDGLFGIWELPYIISILISLLVFVFIINAFNLIDGIDGLAGTIAIIASSVFGFFFMFQGNILLMLVSFILVGALLAFLRFNFSEENKLFMGDSGSLFIGFLLTYRSEEHTSELQSRENLVFRLPPCSSLFPYTTLFRSAGTIAIIASSVFGFFFMFQGNILLMLVSFILVGALLAFLRFNFSEENKLFMGDSGSLFIGFLLTY